MVDYTYDEWEMGQDYIEYTKEFEKLLAEKERIDRKISSFHKRTNQISNEEPQINMEGLMGAILGYQKGSGTLILNPEIADTRYYIQNPEKEDNKLDDESKFLNLLEVDEEGEKSSYEIQSVILTARLTALQHKIRDVMEKMIRNRL